MLALRYATDEQRVYLAPVLTINDRKNHGAGAGRTIFSGSAHLNSSTNSSENQTIVQGAYASTAIHSHDADRQGHMQILGTSRSSAARISRYGNGQE